MNKWNYSVPGIPDEMFFRGKVPMTKEEVRAVTISKLRLMEDSKILDIGAGTGSISIEAALISKSGNVTSIERNNDGIQLIKYNIEKFGIKNMSIIEGYAPQDLPMERFDRIVIGGTGGNMNEVLAYVDEHLEKGGRLVLNFITIENLYKAIEYLRNGAYDELDLAEVSVSKGTFIKTVTMMKAHNPVYVLSCTKI